MNDNELVRAAFSHNLFMRQLHSKLRYQLEQVFTNYNDVDYEDDIDIQNYSNIVAKPMQCGRHATDEAIQFLL